MTTDDKAPLEKEIRGLCEELATMLCEKNKAYGNSALDPMRVFSRADPLEQIKVRIDDKLSRIARGRDAGEDPVWDLMGYLILYKLAQRLRPAAESSR